MRELSRGSFIRALISFMDNSYDLITSQIPHFPILSPWGLGFQYMNFCGKRATKLYI